MDERVTQLRLTVMDIANDVDGFLQALQVFLVSQGATANGICDVNVNPKTGNSDRYIKIINNQPVLSIKQEVKHD